MVGVLFNCAQAVSTEQDDPYQLAELQKVIDSQTQKPTKVTLDKENMLYVDGRPFIPIFLWWGGSEQTAVLGENITRRSLTADPKVWERQSPVQYSFVRVSGRGGVDWESDFRARIPLIKQHPSTLAYFLIHEPHHIELPPKKVNAMARLVKELDPDHPSFVHIGGSDPERAKLYSQDSDIVSISSVYGPANIAVKMNMVRLGVNDKKAVWPCIQPLVYPPLGETSFPDYYTFRSTVYSGIIHGAKAFSVFAPGMYYRWYEQDYSKGPDPGDERIIDLYNRMDEVLNEVRYMTPIIAAPTPKQLFTITGDDGNIAALLKAVGGELFLITANLTDQTVTAKFDISKITKGRSFVVLEPLGNQPSWYGRKISSDPAKGTFTDEFKPYDARLYRIGARENILLTTADDPSFEVPLETESEKIARLKKQIERILPKFVMNPIANAMRWPFFDEKDGVRYIQFHAGFDDTPIDWKPVAAKTTPYPKLSKPADKPVYLYTTRFAIAADGKQPVEIHVTDHTLAKNYPVALMLIDQNGKELFKKYIVKPHKDRPTLITQKLKAGNYTLTVKGDAYSIDIEGAAFTADAGKCLSSNGETVRYFYVPEGVKQFAITAGVLKGRKKGRGEGALLEVIDPNGKIIGSKIAKYIATQAPIEGTGGEQAGWSPVKEDPAAAKVTVSVPDNNQGLIYAFRTGPPPADSELSYVPISLVRLDPPLDALVADDPKELMINR